MITPNLYLCGPMTGLPECNYPAFMAAATALRAAGYIVVNPAENGLHRDAPWESHMRYDIVRMMREAHAVATLPGCEASRGAVVEIGLATGLGWRVHSVEQWLEFARTTREAEALMEPRA